MIDILSLVVDARLGRGVQCAVHEYRELKQKSFYVLEAERNLW